MPRSTPLLIIVALATGLTGCFDVEQKVSLKKDLSGTVAFDVHIDMESMVYMMAFMQKAMTGRPGGADPSAMDVSKAEFEAAKKAFLAKQKDPGAEAAAKTKARREVEAGLPKGVKLASFDVKSKGLEADYLVRLAFDDVRKLKEVDIGAMAGQAAPGSGPAGAGQGSPFAGLEVNKGPGFVELSTKMDNIGAGQRSPDDLPGNVGQVMKKALGKAEVRYVIETSLPVLEHNATKKRGKTLIWKFDYETMVQASKNGTPVEMRVKLKT